jgi:Zn finger protein HypA/HybF involved in hydrogenase expression
MHELAITQGIVEMIVERTGRARVTAVHLRIGKVSGVVPDAVRFCFDLVAPGWRSTSPRVAPGAGRATASSTSRG